MINLEKLVVNRTEKILTFNIDIPLPKVWQSATDYILNPECVRWLNDSIGKDNWMCRIENSPWSDLTIAKFSFHRLAQATAFKLRWY